MIRFSGYFVPHSRLMHWNQALNSMAFTPGAASARHASWGFGCCRKTGIYHTGGRVGETVTGSLPFLRFVHRLCGRLSGDRVKGRTEEKERGVEETARAGPL